MLKYLNLFILLFSGFISKCLMMKNEAGCYNGSQWCTGQKNEASFRKDYTYIEAGKSFYKFHNVIQNWYDAKRVCDTEGARLFYAENSDEANAVISFWKLYHDSSKPTYTYVFVGISDLKSEGEFETIDGRPISDVYHRWRPGQPNKIGLYGEENCLTMNQDGEFSDYICDAKFHFICKKSLSSLQAERKCIIKSDRMRSLISNNSMINLKMFVFWPNATVPFYINPDHFDSEQTTAIKKSLKMFAIKTCIKFTPLMSAPSEGQHVMTFVNPEGLRRCIIETKGHSNYNLHFILLGYECINTPQLDMIIMRALGLPFEHNRMSRDLYIDVLIENVEPSYIQLFTKDCILPKPLRDIPYDHNSVMHFGERDYSKNGHRTIKFKKHNLRHDRKGLTDADIKRIALIYGPECRTRDRAEKVAICSQSYPSNLSRRKREIIEPPANMSLRVNPNITPPAHITAVIAEDANNEKPQEIDAEIDGSDDTTESLNTIGIVKESDRIIELVYQLFALTLKNGREKYCNVTSNWTSEFEFNSKKPKNHTKASDVLGVHKILADFEKSIIADAANNLTKFCRNSETLEAYQSQCKLENDARCPKTYRASKSGLVKLPSNVYHKLDGKDPDSVKDKKKTDGEVPTTTLKPNRRKREGTNTVTTPKSAEEIKEKQEAKIKNEGRKENKVKEKVQAMKKERLKEVQKDESAIKSEVVSAVTTDSKVKDDNNEHSRKKFSEKRFKPQKSRDTSDWEESDTSLNKKIDPEKTLITNKALLKKVLKLEASSIFHTEKARQESVEVVNNAEKTAESSAGSTNTNEDHETTEEEGETAVTKTRKENIKADEPSFQEVDPDEIEDTPHKKIRHKSKRTQKHGILPKTVELSKLNKEFYNERIWPDGVVIYVVAELPDYDLEDLRSRLAAVNGILMEKTCVKLREVDAKEAEGFEDYMILDTSPDYVTGRVGGKQNFGSIELFEGGHHKQHTAMVVMAMLGFYFEVSRHDRDKHIRVHNRHIRAGAVYERVLWILKDDLLTFLHPDKLHHFEKIRDEATLDLPYDYKSATHPAWQFWRRVGKKGISTVATYKEQDPDGSVMRALGQNPELLSKSDIMKINSVYGVECFQSNRASNKKGSLRMLEEEDDVIQ